MGRAWPCRLRSTCVIENKTGLEIRLRKPVTFRSDNETRTRKRGRGGSLIPRQRRREGGNTRFERVPLSFALFLFFLCKEEGNEKLFDPRNFLFHEHLPYRRENFRKSTRVTFERETVDEEYYSNWRDQLTFST